MRREPPCHTMPQLPCAAVLGLPGCSKRLRHHSAKSEPFPLYFMALSTRFLTVPRSLRGAPAAGTVETTYVVLLESLLLFLCIMVDATDSMLVCLMLIVLSFVGCLDAV